MYYLDWIRVFIVLILIPFHCSVSFSHIGKAYVYTNEPVNSFLYILISDFFNLWFMRTLFFISGIAAYLSLKSKRRFLMSKIKRLFIPVMFTLLVIGPLSGYFIHLKEGTNTVSFLKYYPSFFTEPTKYLFWGHMWYCVYLFAFSLILLPVLSLLKKQAKVINYVNKKLSRGGFIFLPSIIIILSEFLLRPHFPGYQKLIGDWANVCVYTSFFILGFIIGDNKSVYKNITGKYIIFLAIALISTTLFIYIKRGESLSEYKNFINIIWGLSAYSWTMAVIGIGQKFLNFKSQLLEYLSKTSFSFYLFHYLIVTVFNWIFLKINMHHIFKWISSIVLSFITLLLLYEILIKNIKLLRFICGLR